MWHRWTGNATRGNDGQATRDISLHLGTTRSTDGHVARIQARGRSQGTINGPIFVPIVLINIASHGIHGTARLYEFGVAQGDKKS